MKKINKALSVVLCLLLALSCFGVVSFAEDAAPQHEHHYQGTYVAPTCVDRGYTLYVCSGCGDTYKTDYVKALGHDFGPWEDVRDVSCSQEGLMVRKCSRCNGEETKTIPVTAHVDDNEDGKCDICGADMPIKKLFSPYEWLMSFIAFIRNLIQGIFA